MSSSSHADSLINAIDGLLQGMSGSALSSITKGSGPDNLYEVWLWSVLVHEAELLPDVSVTLEERTPQNELRFRKGPGDLRTAGYSYAVLARAGNPTLEAHIGTFVLGVSSVRHEADVLVLPVRVASACRATPGGIPWHDKLVMVLEAKFSRDTTKALWLGHGRGLLGLDQEPNHLLALVSNRGSSNVSMLLGSRFFPDTWVGTSSTLESKLSAELVTAM
jgi:hypothetical protein